jgi:hypothetical protein
MLENFNNLTTLSIVDYLPALFVDNFLCERTNFHLNEFKLRFDPANPDYLRQTIYHPHIASFLRKQPQLKKLSFGGMLLTGDIIDSTLRIPGLNEFIMDNCSCDALTDELIQNQSIKKLCFKYSISKALTGMILIIRSCHNNPELCLYDDDVQNEISTAIANSKIEKIVFNSGRIFPMNYPTVTTIEFGTNFGHLCLNDIIEVIEENQQVKSLKLPEMIKYHPRYHFLMKKLKLEDFELHNIYFTAIVEKPSTVEKYLDYLLFVPAILLFMYFFWSFVIFTTSDQNID